MATQSTLLRGGSINIVTRAESSWWNSLTSRANPKWAAAADDQERYRIAFSINHFKAQNAPGGRPVIFNTPERVRLLSYLEAILPDDSPVIRKTWGSSTTIPDLPDLSTDFTGSSKAGADRWDHLAASISGTAADHIDSWETGWKSDANVKAATPHFINCQFTFLLALAKRGSMTRGFQKKTLASLQQQLDLVGEDLYLDEVPWICKVILDSKVLDTNEKWANFFSVIKSKAADIERVSTIIGWAVGSGITKAKIVQQAFKTYPRFDWKAIERRCAGEMEKCHQVLKEAKDHPYRAFYKPEAEPNVWEPSSFMDLAHICWLLLTMGGDPSLAGYAGFNNHVLKDFNVWRTAIASYLQAVATRAADTMELSGENIILPEAAAPSGSGWFTP